MGEMRNQAGLDYWVNVLGNGWSSRDEMILTVIGGAQNEDADVLANKTEVGLYFADELGLGGDGPFSLEDVTANPATVYYAKASIDALDSWPPVPQPEPEQRYDDIFNFTDSGNEFCYALILRT
ncbi:MAG: hypothetical protein U5K27_05980 [Desulfotignum sp.]|nr:hypothetical protein [Desulfotignum sp.]